ncbi:MAG: hypothetical protein C4326_12610 [Ignavibacteria bacterium]
MTRKQAGIAAVIMLAAFCGFEIYHQTGIVHATRKNGYGCLCHGFNPNDTVRVWIAGPDSLRAGASATYRVFVVKQGAAAAGFNVAAFRGSLGIVDSIGTQLLTESPGIDSLELTHTLPKLANGSDTVSWVFSYTAPMLVGFIDTLYAVGNAVNLDTLPDGDAWNFSQNFLVRVLSPTSVAETTPAATFKLVQNYPNPFGVPAGQASTRIVFSVYAPGFMQLEVFDVLGREIATLVRDVKDAGRYEVEFDARNLPSGEYFYRLRSGGLVETRKMVFLR